MIKKCKKINLKKILKFIFLLLHALLPEDQNAYINWLFALKKIFKVQTFMYYLPNEIKQPIHKNFQHYKINYTNIIEDQKDNILIMPEHYEYLNTGLNYSNIKKIIWWLSIDNYYGFKFRYTNKKLLRSFFKIPYNLIKLFNKATNFYFGIFTYTDYLKLIYKFSNFSKQKEISQASLHLMQSYYAHDFLKDKVENSQFLFDYQNKKLLKSSYIKNNKKRKFNLLFQQK